MKQIIRTFVFNIFALWLTSEIVPALSIHGGWQVFAFAGLVLSILMIIVAPLLKILFIPINIITFGLASWFINVIVIFLLTLFVLDVTISAWTFPGYTWLGFVIPSMDLNYPTALIVVSLTITCISNFLHSITED